MIRPDGGAATAAPAPISTGPGTRVQLLIALINSEGMGRFLVHDVPIFAGLADLASRSRPRNYTILSVIREEEKVDRVIDLLQKICGNLEDPATGIVFTVPVTRAVGLSPELGSDG